MFRFSRAAARLPRMMRAAVAQRPEGAAVAPLRRLNIHECDSHMMLKKYNIPVPLSAVANNSQEAAGALKILGQEEVVVKAQVLAGGRGKGHFDTGFQGGVHIVKGATEAAKVADEMIGKHLITKQTGEGGRICNKVLVVEKLEIEKEFYFAILLDRAAQGPVVVASAEGGMNIEEVAETKPEALHKMPIDITKGLMQEQADELADKLGFSDPSSKKEAASIFMNIYNLFIERDATMVEINPLAMLTDKRVLCMDAKLNFDDNAAMRQKEVFELRDVSQENPIDVQASKFDLNFIGLEGNIGCLVNGAGLAMATLDIITMCGGKPANFLDVGGGATAKQVTEAFKLITADPHVTAILVNIFGGIMRCDVIAEGIIKAASTLDLQVPVVVRLQGTKQAEANALIAASGMDILSVDELDAAANQVVNVSEIVTMARKAGVQVKFQNKQEPSAGSEEITPKFT